MLSLESLACLALVMSVISMVLSSIALWPQWKTGISVVRDFVLWAALIFVVVGVLNVFWRKQTAADRTPRNPDVYARTGGAPAVSHYDLEP